jgi:hypothetical protein
MKIDWRDLTDEQFQQFVNAVRSIPEDSATAFRRMGEGLYVFVLPTDDARSRVVITDEPKVPHSELDEATRDEQADNHHSCDVGPRETCWHTLQMTDGPVCQCPCHNDGEVTDDYTTERTTENVYR